jgi:AraC-like DNA-binding protein
MSEMAIRSQFSNELERLRKRIAKGGGRLFVPEPIGLHTRRHASHFHTTPEFFLQTGGATDFECPSRLFRLQTGDICVIPAGVPHAETPIDLKTPYGVIVLMNHAAGCMLLRGWADESRRIQSGDFLHTPLPTKAFSFLEEASNQHRLPKSLQRGFSTGLVTAFLVSVLSGLNTDAAQQESASTPLVAEVEKIIRVEISRPDLSVASLAARVGCSADHLTRRFRAERGVALNAWITRERVDLACNLLERPEHNVAEVGWACGFSSPSYFISVFTRHKKATPLAWRRTRLRRAVM